MSLFKKAERKRAKLKIAITGPSGSGKTFSALELASGLGPKVAVIDTENDSASLYSDRFNFDTLVIAPPFTHTKYIEAIRDAESNGYDVVIIDSLSHAWAGEGGILDRKNKIDAQGGNSFSNWKKPTEEHEQLKNAILQADIHVIANMRSKQEYIVAENDKGKSAPRKVGLAPVQREGMEYEFTVVFDISMDHSFHVSKDRTGLFDSRIERMSAANGKELIKWLSAGKPTERPKTRLQLMLDSFAKFDVTESMIANAYGQDDLSKLTEVEVEELRAIHSDLKNEIRTVANCFPQPTRFGTESWPA